MAGKGPSVEFDKEILARAIEADTYQKMSPQARTKYEDSHELSRNIRELEIYRLLQKMVGDMNVELKGKPEKLRLYDEGKGLFLEMAP